MMSAGHSVAMQTTMSQFSKTAYYSNLMRGYRFYELIQKLDEEFEERKEEIADKLNELVRLIFTKDNLIVSLTADDEGFSEFETTFDKFVIKINDEKYQAAIRNCDFGKTKIGFTSSSQVNYVARCGNFLKSGFDYTGALKVLKVIFSYEYLWLNVRVKGGAYGCMSNFNRNGDAFMVSYRDPNLAKTNEIFENAADYIETFEVSDRDMVKFIIGTIGDMDAPLGPASKGVRSFGAYICNADMDMLKKEREEVLCANASSIRALAPLIRTVIDDDYFGVVGNQSEIQKESAMFDVIKPLVISANQN